MFLKGKSANQVAYLDHIDFGPNNVPSNIYPRVAAYTMEKLIQLIEMDRIPAISTLSFTFGAIHVC